VTGAQHRLLLAQRRADLVRRAQQQRVQLAEALAPVAHAARWADLGVGLWRSMRDRPGLAFVSVLGPAVLLALYKPRILLRTAATLLMLWRTGRSVQRALGAPSVIGRAAPMHHPGG
jgi:hypothetical protein